MSGIESKEDLIQRGVSFLLFRDGKVLLERKKYPGKPYNGNIIVPGGHVEPGETFEEALVREIYEECGVVPREYLLLDTFDSVSPAGNYFHIQAYLVTCFDGEIKNMEGPSKTEHLLVDIDKANDYIKLLSSRYPVFLTQLRLSEKGQLTG